MGVEGSGKSTVGRALADALGWHFAEGDDFHSEANKEKMHRGVSLTDKDRGPWLSALHSAMSKWHAEATNVVLAASALREIYRQQLFAGLPTSDYRIVYLDGPRRLLTQRVGARSGHFASPLILESQLRTLEPPQDATSISIGQTVEEQVNQIRSALHL